MLQTITSPRGAKITLCDGEKVSTVMDTHIATASAKQKPILELLKTANAARKDSHIKEAGLQWLAQNRKRVTA